MKKTCSVLGILLIALLLWACSDKEVSNTDLNFPKLNWGMNWEDVMEEGGITKDYLADDRAKTQYGSAYVAEGYEVFGEKSDKTRFDFIDFGSGTKGLTSVIVEYPDQADMSHVLEEMQKAYGSTVPEAVSYQLFNSLDDGALLEDHYKESEHVKIWTDLSVGEAIPDGEEDEYKKIWQDQPHSSASTSFQPGLNNESWDEFSSNAKMAMVLWLEDGQDVLDSGNKLYFLAWNRNAYNEITRRILEQKKE